jgi:hypothetical protein
MKLVLVLLLFVKFSFAYELYSADGHYLSEPEDHDGLYKDCNFKRDIKLSEINDADVMRCFLRYSRWIPNLKILYCEPPKIINENNECALEIDFEQWKKVMESAFVLNDFASLKFIHLKNVNSKKNKKHKFSNGAIITVIGKTSENKYEPFEMETCFKKMTELAVNEGKWGLRDKITTMELILTLTPQLLSITCYLILLIFYLAVEELKKTIYGKCWINFIINSLINYSGTIVVLVIVHLEKYWKYSELGEITESLQILIISIVVFTEFSLYSWLNITFFEAFYTIRYKFRNHSYCRFGKCQTYLITFFGGIFDCSSLSYKLQTP